MRINWGLNAGAEGKEEGGTYRCLETATQGPRVSRGGGRGNARQTTTAAGEWPSAITSPVRRHGRPFLVVKIEAPSPTTGPLLRSWARLLSGLGNSVLVLAPGCKAETEHVSMSGGGLRVVGVMSDKVLKPISTDG